MPTREREKREADSAGERASEQAGELALACFAREFTRDRDIANFQLRREIR
jgi:hypothetical protein